MSSFSDVVGNWKSFELFIMGLYQEFDDAQARHNVTLTDVDGASRQVDVLVTFSRGPHKFLVIVECKHWSKNVERKDIDELLITVEKTNASKGVIFTTCGYQSGALTTAQRNGIDAFLVRDPHKNEWRPETAQDSHLQLCTYCPEDKLSIPTDAIEVGADEPWPSGIKTAPAVSFGRNRTSTPILSRNDRKSLEDLVEEAVRGNLERVIAPIGRIGNGKDCVGHFAFRCDLKFDGPVIVQERPCRTGASCASGSCRRSTRRSR
jgi:hypothetical protein